MKIPKEFEARLKHLEQILPRMLDVKLLVLCPEDDEAFYTINHGSCKGSHTVFREDDESEASFLARVEKQAREMSPKSYIIIVSNENYMELSRMDHVIESQSPASIRFKQQMRKMRRERAQREAAAKNPGK
jgi:hypothetical protein